METEMSGYWWKATGDPDDRIAGTLTIAPGKLPVLDLIGSLEDEPPLLSRRPEDVILGRTNEGRNVTLLRAVGTTGLQQHDEVVFSERWIAQVALLGTHAVGPEEARVSYLDIEMDVLDELVGSGFEESQPDGDARRWRWVQPQAYLARRGDMEVTIDVAPHGGWVDGQSHELRFWAVPRIRVAWREPVNLHTVLVDAIYPLYDLCSLLAGRPGNLERTLVYRSSDPPTGDRFAESRIELITNPSRRSADEDRQSALVTTLERSSVPISELIPAWLDLWSQDDLRLLLDRYFTQDGRPSPFPESTFLGLAVFLEGFHKAVHGGDKFYVDRLRVLFEEVGPIVRSIGADTEKLTETVKDTRNALAHGKAREGDRTVEGHEVGVLNQTLDLLIRAQLLLRVGFTEDQLLGLLRIAVIRVGNQSRSASWHDDAIG